MTDSAIDWARGHSSGDQQADAVLLAIAKFYSPTAHGAHVPQTALRAETGISDITRQVRKLERAGRLAALPTMRMFGGRGPDFYRLPDFDSDEPVLDRMHLFSNSADARDEGHDSRSGLEEFDTPYEWLANLLDSSSRADPSLLAVLFAVVGLWHPRRHCALADYDLILGRTGLPTGEDFNDAVRELECGGYLGRVLTEYRCSGRPGPTAYRLPYFDPMAVRLPHELQKRLSR